MPETCDCMKFISKQNYLINQYRKIDSDREIERRNVIRSGGNSVLLIMYLGTISVNLWNSVHQRGYESC